MHISVAQIKAKFSAIALQADAGEEVIITNRGKPAYRLLPIVDLAKRAPFPDVSALAKKSKPYNKGQNFVADWRAESTRF